jgi:hypothetical protein
VTVLFVIIISNFSYERQIVDSFWRGAPMNDLEYCEKLASQTNRMGTGKGKGIAYCIETKLPDCELAEFKDHPNQFRKRKLF